MHTLTAPPFSAVEPVVDTLHGVTVTDPYRWLEDQNSPQTRAWIEEQTRYARAYLDKIPGRDRIRDRVRDLLDIETYDSFLKIGNRYFFRKRLRGKEQPSIYFREGADGEDQLLVDPAERGTGDYTAVKPLRASADGSLLLYEVKQGGERMGSFEILDVPSRENCRIRCRMDFYGALPLHRTQRVSTTFTRQQKRSAPFTEPPINILSAQILKPTVKSFVRARTRSFALPSSPIDAP